MHHNPKLDDLKTSSLSLSLSLLHSIVSILILFAATVSYASLVKLFFLTLFTINKKIFIIQSIGFVPHQTTISNTLIWGLWVCQVFMWSTILTSEMLDGHASGGINEDEDWEEWVYWRCRCNTRAKDAHGMNGDKNQHKWLSKTWLYSTVTPRTLT